MRSREYIGVRRRRFWAWLDGGEEVRLVGHGRLPLGTFVGRLGDALGNGCGTTI